MTISDEEFLDLFRRMRKGAFRLELRDRYNVPAERERWDAYQARDWPRLDELNRVQRKVWLDLMREITASGRRVERVRVVTEPPSDYIRFELTLNPGNAEAGEDIRYLPRDQASGLNLPEEDYWLFDEQISAVLRFDEEDRLLAIELVTDSEIVARHVAARKALWALAVPFSEYVMKWHGVDRSSGT